MENRYVVFSLPFPLLIPNSASLDEEPEPEEPEIFVAGDPPADVKTVLMSTEGGTFRAWGELQGGDPYGRISFTRIQVRFHVPTSPEVAGWEHDDLLSHAVGVANSVVSHYRDLADQPLLAGLTVGDIVHFQVIDEEAPGNAHTYAVARGRGPLTTGIGPDQRAIAERLRSRLQRTEPVPFLRTLELDAHRHLRIADYRLAIIESAVFFEAWLTRTIRMRYLDRGEDESAIQTKFRDRRGLPLSIWAVARDLVPDALGFDFLGTQEGEHWAADLKDKRNALIHGSDESATRREAEDALDAVRAACRLIEAQL